MYQNTNHAYIAYGATQKETLTPRSVEYRVFLQITSRLEAAQANGNLKSNEAITAMGDNQLLWNALGADVASVGNQLPEQLKAQIFYLAQYMSHHTSLVRKGEADLVAMIDINKMIMEGLSAPVVTNTVIAGQQQQQSQSMGI